MHPARREAGVTLLESMVTVAIVAILLATGIPGMVEFTRDVRRDAWVSDLLVAMSFARSEAVRRGVPVTLCPAAAGVGCNGDVRWETGWIVFADGNANGVVEDGDEIMRVQQALPAAGTTRGARLRLIYRASGSSPGSNDTLRVCDERGTAKARSVILSMPGRVRVTVGADHCP